MDKAISPCSNSHAAIQPDTSGNNEYFPSLRSKLTGVANSSQQPLPDGLLERIDNCRVGGDMDMALYNDISAYLHSVSNSYPGDVTDPKTDTLNDADNNLDESTTSLSPTQKLLRESIRIIYQIQSLDKAKMQREFDRVMADNKIERETKRVVEQVRNEVPRAVKTISKAIKKWF
ncbi:hypothetical protein [Acerihabitans arboris]|uniref:Uncharacterized protein n=1 Tax=Acerihabitans arboris TaxID=2691583 RepID=A0A845SI62_9GAMM|nr:hypothetical protein [Acerihabitans arboris]NDL62301.1 hypothetical protein [Acerihabitans arboris]